MSVFLDVDISIIIPAKDEAVRLPVFLEKVVGHCQKSKYRYEIIVVDDGSSDRTFEAASEFKAEFQLLKVIKLKKNRGKGFAVKTGFGKAVGNIVLFMDADGSTPVDEIEKNLGYLNEGFDVLVGSRVLKDSMHTVSAKFYRKMIGRVFNFFVHHILFKNIADTQCGFKMFRREAVRPLFSRMNIDRFGFDMEILYLAYKLGFRVKEVPVNWHHVDASKINLLTDSFQMFIDIFNVRSWHFNTINTADRFMSPKEIANMAEHEKTHWWFQSKNMFVKNTIQKFGRKFENVLDAGCGTGLNLSYLKEFGRCCGCDVSLEALNYCKQDGIHNLVQCNLEDLSLKSKKFDLITVLDVLEHTEKPEEALWQLKRVLADDGIMVITVPAFKFLWSPHDEALSHLRRYQRAELVQNLEQAGFEVIKTGYFFFTPFLIAAPIRIFRKFFESKRSRHSDTDKVPVDWLNAVLKIILRLELKLSQIMPLPFGTTLFAIVKSDHFLSKAETDYFGQAPGQKFSMISAEAQ